jgi:hypothetical protein
MTLLILLVLAGIPLLGVVWIAVYGSLTTVDGLFMSLILLAMSGILGATALFELKRPHSAGSIGGGAFAGGSVQSGRVQDVVFYEAHVGEPNKSIVTLSNDGRASQTLVVEGDARNALPVGQKVQITLRKQHGQNVLADVIYS